MKFASLTLGFKKYECYFLYEAADTFFLVGTDAVEIDYRIIIIDRSCEQPSSLSQIITCDPLIYSKTTLSIFLNTAENKYKFNGGIKKVATACGIVGFVRFIDCYYLNLITQRKLVGNIGNHLIYTIKAVEIFPIKIMPINEGNSIQKLWNHVTKQFHQTPLEITESKYMGLYSFIDMTKDFYFSYTYDLTYSLQHNFLRSHAYASEREQDHVSSSSFTCMNKKTQFDSSDPTNTNGTTTNTSVNHTSSHSSSLSSSTSTTIPTSSSSSRRIKMMSPQNMFIWNDYQTKDFQQIIYTQYTHHNKCPLSSTVINTTAGDSINDNINVDNNLDITTTTINDKDSNNNKNNSTACNIEIDEEVYYASCKWILPLIHGYYIQKHFTSFGYPLDLILITRRSRHYAGTRYLKRGCNNKGHVANDCETEQITQIVQGIHTKYTSYIQMRGSIPCHWSQETSVTLPKPPIHLYYRNPSYYTTQLHFQDLLQRYHSPIIVLDLVKQYEKKDRERVLGQEFYDSIHEINNNNISYLNQIWYYALDYAKITKSKKAYISNDVNTTTTTSRNKSKSTAYLPTNSNSSRSIITNTPYTKSNIMSQVDAMDDRSNFGNTVVSPKKEPNPIITIPSSSSSSSSSSCNMYDSNHMYFDLHTYSQGPYTTSSTINTISDVTNPLITTIDSKKPCWSGANTSTITDNQSSRLYTTQSSTLSPYIISSTTNTSYNTTDKEATMTHFPTVSPRYNATSFLSSTQSPTPSSSSQYTHGIYPIRPSRPILTDTIKSSLGTSSGSTTTATDVSMRESYPDMSMSSTYSVSIPMYSPRFIHSPMPYPSYISSQPAHNGTNKLMSTNITPNPHDTPSVTSTASIDILQELGDISTVTLYHTGIFCNTTTHLPSSPLSHKDTHNVPSISASLTPSYFDDHVIQASLANGYILQKGTLRTNCIDCLDRTNVAQFTLGVKILNLSLKLLGLSPTGISTTTTTTTTTPSTISTTTRDASKQDSTLPTSASSQSLPSNSSNMNIPTILLDTLMDMYSDMGDHISLQYGGSEAHKKFASAHHYTTFSSSTSSSSSSTQRGSELLTSIKRYYSNSFTDTVKQDAMNVFLGCYIPNLDKNTIQLWDYENDYYLHNDIYFDSYSNTFKALLDMKQYIHQYKLSDSRETASTTVLIDHSKDTYDDTIEKKTQNTLDDNGELIEKLSYIIREQQSKLLHNHINGNNFQMDSTNISNSNIHNKIERYKKKRQLINYINEYITKLTNEWWSSNIRSYDNLIMQANTHIQHINSKKQVHCARKQVKSIPNTSRNPVMHYDMHNVGIRPTIIKDENKKMSNTITNIYDVNTVDMNETRISPNIKKGGTSTYYENTYNILELTSFDDYLNVDYMHTIPLHTEDTTKNVKEVPKLANTTLTTVSSDSINHHIDTIDTSNSTWCNTAYHTVPTTTSITEDKNKMSYIHVGVSKKPFFDSVKESSPASSNSSNSSHIHTQPLKKSTTFSEGNMKKIDVNTSGNTVNSSDNIQQVLMIQNVLTQDSLTSLQSTLDSNSLNLYNDYIRNQENSNYLYYTKHDTTTQKEYESILYDFRVSENDVHSMQSLSHNYHIYTILPQQSTPIVSTHNMHVSNGPDSSISQAHTNNLYHNRNHPISSFTSSYDPVYSESSNCTSNEHYTNYYQGYNQFGSMMNSVSFIQQTSLFCEDDLNRMISPSTAMSTHTPSNPIFDNTLFDHTRIANNSKLPLSPNVKTESQSQSQSNTKISPTFGEKVRKNLRLMIPSSMNNTIQTSDIAHTPSPTSMIVLTPKSTTIFPHEQVHTQDNLYDNIKVNHIIKSVVEDDLSTPVQEDIEEHITHAYESIHYPALSSIYPLPLYRGTIISIYDNLKEYLYEQWYYYTTLHPIRLSNRYSDLIEYEDMLLYLSHIPAESIINDLDTVCTILTDLPIWYDQLSKMLSTTPLLSLTNSKSSSKSNTDLSTQSTAKDNYFKPITSSLPKIPFSYSKEVDVLTTWSMILEMLLSHFQYEYTDYTIQKLNTSHAYDESNVLGKIRDSIEGNKDKMANNTSLNEKYLNSDNLDTKNDDNRIVGAPDRLYPGATRISYDTYSRRNNPYLVMNERAAMGLSHVFPS